MEDNIYQNGKIYKIIDIGYNLTYYGSTTEKLCRRISKHRYLYNNNKNNCKVIEIFNKYGIENCKIELVENYSCNNKNELEAREGYYIKNNDCVNKRIEGRTRKEWYQDNKDDIRKQKKQYQEANKEKIKEYKKQYREDNKEKIKEQKRLAYLKKKALPQNEV
jgi:adenylate kinase family enzyme